jgi:hypothetical protein
MLRLRSALKSSRAAIDLASIMVGVIIIGLIGGVIAATVFAVIPWSQDKAAKQQLDSVHTAQNAFFGLSSDPSQDLTNGKKNSFASSAELSTKELLNSDTTYCTVPTVDGKDYHAYAKSGSGKWFYALNSDKQAQVLTAGLVPCVDTIIDGKPVTVVNPVVDNGTTPVGTTPGTVNPGTAPVSTSTSAMPAGEVGKSYYYTFSASGKPSPSYSSANLPAGLSINSTTGTVTGRPTAAFNGSITVTATNNAGQVDITKTLVINPYSPTIIFSHNGVTALGAGTLETQATNTGAWKPATTVYNVTGQPTAVDRTNQTAFTLRTVRISDVNFKLTVENLEAGTYTFSIYGDVDRAATFSVITDGAETKTTSVTGWTKLTTTFTTTGDSKREIIVAMNMPNTAQYGDSTTWDDVLLTKVG